MSGFSTIGGSGKRWVTRMKHVSLMLLDMRDCKRCGAGFDFLAIEDEEMQTCANYGICPECQGTEGVANLITNIKETFKCLPKRGVQVV